jgi:hypothetical protein
LSLALVAILTLTLLAPVLGTGSPAPAYAAPRQRPIPYRLNAGEVHPGSVVVAFRGAARPQGGHLLGVDNASAQDVDALNNVLDGLGTTQIIHLFANLPAGQLNAMRARAMAATGRYITDFTQVYQIKFNPAIDSADAVNRLIASDLVTAATPDWIYRQPSHEQARLAPAQVQAALHAPRAAVAGVRSSTASLPPNYAYASDAESYQDAASNDVTGAAAMIAGRFHQQPAQGLVVDNVSLGDLNDTSTVLDHGQRYLEQAGLPKIPVWLASCSNAEGGITQACDVDLDPQATTQDEQGDLLEVLLDFSVMAPPPLGDSRVVNAPPAGLGELLGEAYGAQFRLINPLANTTPNFLAAFLGAGLLQKPAPSVITASIGEGFSVGGFSDYFFEQDIIIHDVVSLLVNGADIFVSLSAGDGQTDTTVAMNPNGLTGPTDVTTDPRKIVDINESQAWADPNYSYGLTFEPQYVIDSGSADAGGVTLNDIYNNSPWNLAIDPPLRHDQTTTETRWTGQQNFHSGNGSRVNLAAPADDVLMLAQVEDSNGNPLNPVATVPRLIGGTSCSAPEIAGAAAVVRQAAALLGHPLTARQTRDLLASTARPNNIPAFDLNDDNVGPALDLTRGVETLFDGSRATGQPAFVRMTVAQRKTVLTYTDFRSSFYSDTPQDPAAATATIDLSEGLVAPSSRTDETVGPTGDNVNYPITFAADAAYVPASSATFNWSLQLGGRTVAVPGSWYDARYPFIRLLPSEIFGLLGAPVTASTDRVVAVTITGPGGISLTEKVTFKGQAGATYSHAVPPTFNPIYQPASGDQLETFTYDLRGLRDGNGGLADGGILLVSDIDRAVPQAFPDDDLNAHGFKLPLHGLTGVVSISSAQLPHGVGTYGIALRGTKGGTEIADSTSPWQPLRYAPAMQEYPLTPKIQAQVSLEDSQAPLWYEVADTEPIIGSTKFAVTYDVRQVQGAKGAILEFSAPTYNFAEAAFVTGDFGPTNTDVNNFTNPNGDRFDTGDNYGQPGGVARVRVNGTSGVVTINGAAIGLTIPAGDCDSTYQVRAWATDARGQLIGVAGNPSVLSYTDFSRAGCQ